MNADLELRLTPYEQADQVALDFVEIVATDLIGMVKTKYPVFIEYEDIDTPDYPEDDTGFVDFDGITFGVVLDKRMPVGMVLDYLIHELAHVGTWFVNERDDHGPIFGVEQARLYRRYLELYEEYWGEN